MNILALLIPALILFFLGYRFYARYIAREIGETENRPTPAVGRNDGVDYVPTKKEVIFGHHFTSIAGTGPIVGPAIAIIWGWVPALLWVFVGSIVMGAVHDFGALIISMRNQGKSISDYTSKYINSRTRFLFFLIVFLELWIVIAIFGLVIAMAVLGKTAGKGETDEGNTAKTVLFHAGARPDRHWQRVGLQDDADGCPRRPRGNRTLGTGVVLPFHGHRCRGPDPDSGFVRPPHAAPQPDFET